MKGERRWDYTLSEEKQMSINMQQTGLFHDIHDKVSQKEPAIEKKEKSEQWASQSIFRYYQGVLKCEISMGAGHQFDTFKNVVSFKCLPCSPCRLWQILSHYPQMFDTIFSRLKKETFTLMLTLLSKNNFEHSLLKQFSLS